MVLNNLAASYNSQGKYLQAEALFQRALTISEKTLGPQSPDVATLLVNLRHYSRTTRQILCS